MAGTTRVTLTYADIYGKQWSFTVYVADTVVSPDDAIITGLINVLNACVRAVNLRVEISRAVNYAGTLLATEPYSTVNDKALLVIVDTNGDTHTWKLPGPKTTVFTADTRTVNMAPGSDIETLKDYILLKYQGRGGQSLGEYVKGYRKAARRINKE